MPAKFWSSAGRHAGAKEDRSTCSPEERDDKVLVETVVHTCFQKGNVMDLLREVEVFVKDHLGYVKLPV